MALPILRGAVRSINSDRLDLRDYINDDTTPEEFHALCSKHGILIKNGESFRGCSPLRCAFFSRNWTLVEDILKTGGKDLLNMGGHDDGLTLLHYCIVSIDLPGLIQLVKLGADPNILQPGGLFQEKTVLWELISEMEKYALKSFYIAAKFLLRNRAIAIPELNQRGKKIIEHAEKEMREPLAAVLSNGALPLAMPHVLAMITVSYVSVDEILINDEELEKEVAQLDRLCKERPCQVLTLV